MQHYLPKLIIISQETLDCYTCHLTTTYIPLPTRVGKFSRCLTMTGGVIASRLEGAVKLMYKSIFNFLWLSIYTLFFGCFMICRCMLHDKLKAVIGVLVENNITQNCCKSMLPTSLLPKERNPDTDLLSKCHIAVSLQSLP